MSRRVASIVLCLSFASLCSACSSSTSAEAPFVIAPIQTQEQQTSTSLYTADDLCYQSALVAKRLMDRWTEQSGSKVAAGEKPRFLVHGLDNRAGVPFSHEDVANYLDLVASKDGRFTIMLDNTQDEEINDLIVDQYISDPDYSTNSTPSQAGSKAPQFLTKVRLTKAVTSDHTFNYEDYRLSILIYDIETQELIDSAWDILRKQDRST